SPKLRARGGTGKTYTVRDDFSRLSRSTSSRSRSSNARRMNVTAPRSAGANRRSSVFTWRDVCASRLDVGKHTSQVAALALLAIREPRPVKGLARHDAEWSEVQQAQVLKNPQYVGQALPRPQHADLCHFDDHGAGSPDEKTPGKVPGDAGHAGRRYRFVGLDLALRSGGDVTFPLLPFGLERRGESAFVEFELGNQLVLTLGRSCLRPGDRAVALDPRGSEALLEPPLGVEQPRQIPWGRRRTRAHERSLTQAGSGDCEERRKLSSERIRAAE
ncbi:MAG TPA: hypothetical protein VGU74_05345, partial [Gemmatimonadales bacterium]|nr:hypothetical protein [Gemmatimonadales bacterium]